MISGVRRHGFDTGKVRHGYTHIVDTPSTFQKAMTTILKPLLGAGVLIYLDDIIIMAVTFEKHLKLLREVFILLRNVSLMVNLEKCKFLRK